MSDDSPFNLFKQQPKKPPSGKLPATPSVKIPANNIENEKTATPRPSSNEFKDVVDKVAKMHDDLQKKLEETYQKAGWSKNEIKLFLENPNNFNESEWERVQRERKHFSNQIWSVVGEDTKDRLALEDKKKESHGNKGKFLGARKKNWIPMR